MDDSQLYTGVDNEPKGILKNEITDSEVRDKIQEQEKLIKELSPNIQELLDIIDAEIKSVMSVDRFLTATTQKKEDIRAELQSAALYKKYLDGLKTKFVLALREANGRTRKKTRV